MSDQAGDHFDERCADGSYESLLEAVKGANRTWADAVMRGAPTDQVERAQAAHWAAVDAAVRRRQEDELEAEHATLRVAAIEREADLLARPLNEAVDRVVTLLRREGPLSGVEIEAPRLPGLSHNVLRPVLREAVNRGHARRLQVGNE